MLWESGNLWVRRGVCAVYSLRRDQLRPRFKPNRSELPKRMHYRWCGHLLRRIMLRHGCKLWHRQRLHRNPYLRSCAGLRTGNARELRYREYLHGNSHLRSCFGLPTGNALELRDRKYLYRNPYLRSCTALRTGNALELRDGKYLYRNTYLRSSVGLPIGNATGEWRKLWKCWRAVSRGDLHPDELHGTA